MAGQSFKTYSRGYREQAAEESFKEGQVFTRAPLSSGKSRLLVNYDIINDGEALTNRRGYRTTMLGTVFSNGELVPTITENAVSHIGKDVVEEDDSKYRLIITQKYNDTNTKVSGTNLYASHSEMHVIQTDPSATKYNCLEEYGIESRNLYTVPVCYSADDESTEKPKAYFKIPDVAKVHGITISKQKYLARPIGCFAFSNDYYNFNTNGDLIRTIYDAETKTYAPSVLKPKEVTASEVTSFGFNMLSKTPFVFNNEYLTSGAMELNGFMVYKDGEPVAFPLMNTPYNITLYYGVTSGKKYKFVWEYCETSQTEYTQLKTEDVSFNKTDTDPLPKDLTLTNFQSPYEKLTMRVSVYLYSGSTAASTPEAEISMSIEFSKNNKDAFANKKLINYDLSTVSGMTYWKNRLWLYGLAQDPTVLFCSDINDPSYFPYPNNVDIFDEPIVSVAPFNDNLLVFTKNEIVQLTLSTDGSWTKKVLQGNLNFTDFDANFIQVVKNMVFFKSGDYYYMIVPKTLSLQNELAIAPVSKNINSFLDEFDSNITNFLEVMYEYTGAHELIAHYNYLNYEDIHNVYTFKLGESNVLLNIVLLYNTVDRTWRIYTYQSGDIYVPLRQDATNQCILLSTIKCTVDTRNTLGVQFIETSRSDISDFYILANTQLSSTTKDAGVLSEKFDEQYIYKNWQILDTGYRNDIIDLNKRYRELQIKFNNVSSANLKFITEFILDGETRIGRYKYTAEHITDPTSPNYGLISIVRTPVENLDVPGGSILGINAQDINAWILDASRFPEIAYWKARLKVSGKGYTPRFRLICRTEEQYELLGYTWVYRLMYSR